MDHFHFYTKKEILELTRLRKYETKLGEKVQVTNQVSADSEKHQMFEGSSKYVCFGIPESIGVMANGGIKGTENTWFHFVNTFLNIQSTDHCDGSELLMAGYFDFSDVLKVIEENSYSFEERIDACRHAVANIIDEAVETFVKWIVAAGKIPIVIGGGHNNSYPIIKGISKKLYKMGKIPGQYVNAFNLDAYADFRIMEGRHSGNGFRYAMEEGYLKRYAIVGLQENENPQSMMDDIYSNVNIQYHTYEEIFVEERLNFLQSLAQSFSFLDEDQIALEIDLGVMSQTHSNGPNPSGISVKEVRQFIMFSGHYQNVCSLHISEGIVDHLRSDSHQLAKWISYLVTDFIKSRS